MMTRKQASEEHRTEAENMGTLISSGFIAGESLMAVLLAFLVLGADLSPFFRVLQQTIQVNATPSYILGLVIYPALVYLLIWIPIRKIDAAKPLD